jgi:leucyl-tRNA synthetase
MEVGKEEVKNLIKILAPMAPFTAEELWQRLQGESAEFKSVHCQSWPEPKPVELDQSRVVVVVQVNGKLRDKFELTVSEAGDQQTVEQKVIAAEKVGKHLVGKKYKVVFVAGKLINLVTSDG